jgi:hypothetical protein
VFESKLRYLRQGMDLINNPLVTLLSFTLGILEFAFAIFTYFRTKRDLRWKYSVNSSNLIGGRNPLSDEFQLSYKGQKINSVTISKVLLVNIGDVPITAGQIAAREPLEIRVSNGKILDSSISVQSNQASDFKLKSFEYRITLQFSHLNAKDGVVFRVLDTGGSSADLSLHGQLIGFGQPKRVGPLSYDHPTGRWKWLILISLVSLVTLFFTIPSCTPLRVLIPGNDPLAFVPMITALVFLVPLWLFTIVRFFSPLLPLPLRDFHKEE